MKRSASLLICLASLTSFVAAAMPAPAQTIGASEPSPRIHPPSPPAQLDLATAMRMVAGARTAAAARSARVAVCVVDGRGDMVAFGRMDGADIAPGTTAIGKAHTVLVFGLSTGQITDAMSAGKAVSAMVKPPIAGQDNLTFYRGGLPIMKDGKTIGAIGVGGSSSEKDDEAIAQAGIDAGQAQ